MQDETSGGRVQRSQLVEGECRGGRLWEPPTNTLRDQLPAKKSLPADITGHKFEEQDKLAKGTYFWRVKAIDQASNESPWSNSYQLKSGLIPLWLFFTLTGVFIGFSILGAYLVVRRIGSGRTPAMNTPDLVRILQPDHSTALGAPTGPVSIPSPTRRALPSAFRRGRSLSPEEQVKLCYQLLLGRNPDIDELTAAIKLISECHDERKGLADLCLALFNLNEFLYVD